MGQLFGKDKRTISEHITNIFSEGELDENSVVRNFRTTAADGKNYATNHYNLDVIISVGYRVKSAQGTQFRIWETQRLKEYIIKGFTLNDDRFKSGSSMNYFNELQERIREIRLPEKFFYQKIKDIYATSIDYDPKDEKTIEFFKVIQNKLLWSISEQTAARSIILQIKTLSSADLYESNKKIMQWLSGGFILKREDRNQMDIHISLIDYAGLVR